MKHWTQHLSEGKRIFRDDVNEMASKILKIQKLNNEIVLLKKELEEIELHIQVEARKQYTLEEIAQAIQEWGMEDI